MELVHISSVLVCGTWWKRREAGRVRSTGWPHPCVRMLLLTCVCVCTCILGMSVYATRAEPVSELRAVLCSVWPLA